MKDAGDHELQQLAAAAGVTVSQPERSILSALRISSNTLAAIDLDAGEGNETSQNARRSHGRTRLHLRRRT